MNFSDRLGKILSEADETLASKLGFNPKLSVNERWLSMMPKWGYEQIGKHKFSKAFTNGAGYITFDRQEWSFVWTHKTHAKFSILHVTADHQPAEVSWISKIDQSIDKLWRLCENADKFWDVNSIHPTYGSYESYGLKYDIDVRPKNKTRPSLDDTTDVFENGNTKISISGDAIMDGHAFSLINRVMEERGE